MALVAIALLIAGTAHGSWTNVTPTGAFGSEVVGYYYDNDSPGGHYGFLYNTSTSTYTSFGLPNSHSNYPAGISANSVVGTYLVHGQGALGFVLDIATSTYTTLNPFGAQDSNAVGVFGNSVIGTYTSNGHTGGFLYDISTSTFTDLDPISGYIKDNFSNGTTALGYYFDANGVRHNYLYDIYGSTYPALDGPYPDGDDHGAVPEPASVVVWALLGTVGIGYGSWRNRRK